MCWALTKYHLQPLLFENLKQGAQSRQWMAGPGDALRTPFSTFPLASGPLTQSGRKTCEKNHRFGDPIRTEATRCSLPPTSIPAASGWTISCALQSTFFLGCLSCISFGLLNNSFQLTNEIRIAPAPCGGNRGRVVAEAASVIQRSQKVPAEI